MAEKKNYQKLIIFCGSPADVTAERQIVEAVARQLNQPGQPADKAGVVLEVWDWQKHVSPDAGRPETVTLAQLQPEKWDIFLGLLWMKFGSPSGANNPHTGAPFESGTEEEFTYAYEHWKQAGRPRIWFYRCRREADLDVLDPAQFQRVKDFFAQCQAEARHPLFYRLFKTAKEFEDQVRADLTKYLLDEYEKRLAAPLPVSPASALPPSSLDTAALRRRYLQKLQNDCELLPLAAIDETRDPHQKKLTLNQVYIGLNTTTLVDQNGQPIEREKMTGERTENTRALTVLEATAQHEMLVILGDPGSGKSSFVNHLMFMLAAHLLDPANALPETWPHAALLPVRILLRELAVSLQKADTAAILQKSTAESERELARLVYAHIAAHLADYDAPDFNAALRQALDEHRGLVVFDGLDEVPTGGRGLVKRCVEAFCAAAKGNRFLITCRVRSYEREAVLSGVPAVTLAPFDAEQTAAFITGWYEALAQAQQFSAAQAAEKRDDLLAASKSLPPSLVENPLLLTTLANLHSNNVELPRRRVTLYRDAARLLLRRWQEHKAGKISLFEELGPQSDLMLNRAMEELGYLAQNAGRGSEAADIPEDEAMKILKQNFSGTANPRDTASHFLGFVEQNAGLLIGRGGVGSDNIYAFAHRTFQEYFAGCHLLKRRAREAAPLLQKLLAEGDYWRLAAQLGVEHRIYNEDNCDDPQDVIYALCPAPAPELTDTPAWRGIYWAALFALEVGLARIADDKIYGGEEFLGRLKQRLVTILENRLLPARERAEVGFALGKLGDSRPGVLSLPPIWIDLPGGRFTMGDDEYGPPHEVELSPFKISKYLITNAQFAEFIKAGGYDEEKWWSKDGWKYRQENGWDYPRYWQDENFNLPNQPVVGVSWFEADAFCAWLKAKSKEQTANGKKQIRLPTEAEWEFAARGSVGRKFPWGDEEPTVEHANYNELQLNRTTAVGSFPAGATAAALLRNNSVSAEDRQKQILDLAGNVWEWCSDRNSDKYYAECKKRGVMKNPDGPKSGDNRILRGGSYWNNASCLRGSGRLNDYPFMGYDLDAFRVCAAGES